jgi:hypothetical protein
MVGIRTLSALVRSFLPFEKIVVVDLVRAVEAM